MGRKLELAERETIILINLADFKEGVIRVSTTEIKVLNYILESVRSEDIINLRIDGDGEQLSMARIDLNSVISKKVIRSLKSMKKPTEKQQQGLRDYNAQRRAE